ncbi:MAG: hypothetical protein HY924_00750 [Elusimicrobia bacterium]|nr:hypothetical protein [Elusimicrobiota bacterium]
MIGIHPTLPFLNGVYVAVDAVPGAYLIVDGPYCVATKAEMQHCHNIRSGVVNPVGRPKVVHTAGSVATEDVAWLASDRVGAVERVFEQVCSWPEASSVYATSFDFHELVAFPLKELCRRFSGRNSKPVRFIPSASLAGDWLDGYARFCDTLAKDMPLPKSKTKPRSAALVGYLFDRDEGDHRGNLKELRRMFSALGWSVTSVWLSGAPEADLAGVAGASVIVSLPYARQAAKVLARRLGLPLVEAGLPLGLGGTEAFLSTVGRALGCKAKALAFAQAEARQAVAATQAHVQRIICDRQVVILEQDPVLAKALNDLCVELGLIPTEAGPPDKDDQSRPERTGIEFGSSLRGGWEGAEFRVGYPNYADHPILDRPFLGFAGFRHLVDRVASAVLSYESQKGPSGPR